ncbi:MAG: phage tail sheath subtilisin-like domain-containing protein [Gammaproteobacteria bacterium]
MPEYLAPGVFVEEVSFRAKSIEGVGTSVAAIVGPTRTGPLRGTPEVVTSYAEFERVFGDADHLTLGGKSVPNDTALAARAFFDNGGKQLYVARVAKDANNVNDVGDGSSALRASKADSQTRLTFKSRFPGALGNYTLEVHWRDSENLLKSETVGSPEADTVYLLIAEDVTKDARVGASPADGKFPLKSVKALVKLDGSANVAVFEGRGTATAADDSDVIGELSKLKRDKLPANARLYRVYAKQPTGGALGSGTAAELTLTNEADLSAFTKGAHWGAVTRLRGTLDAGGNVFTVLASQNPSVASNLTLPMSSLAAVAPSVRAVVVQTTFDIDVHRGGKNGEVIYTVADISTAPDAANSLAKRLPGSPEKRQDQLTQPVACTIDPAADNGSKVLEALYELFAEDNDALNPTPPSIDGPRYLIKLAGGTDGDLPTSADYAGETDEVHGSVGLSALENVDDVAIVMTPGAVRAGEDDHMATVMEMQKHCRKMRYRVGIVDSREDMTLSDVRNWRSNFSDSRLALYYPWVVTADPSGQKPTITRPPAGFIAGIYANTDVTRGVHKAPANEPVLGALRFAQEINRFQQELLNPWGVNVLRSFPGRGQRVWGGRTMSDDPEWKYVNVRRYFLYLEKSIDRSTQWVVFEPNGEQLWANIRTSVEDFLYNEWRNGHLLGTTPKEAYFVRCDRSTMTQNDLDNGRLVCEVGVAPLRPAEFVIFRIGQKTADANA